MKVATQQTTLTENDFDHLKRGYLLREIVIKAGVYRVDSHEGAALVGRKPKAGTSYAGLVFPYRWPGDAAIREYRLRRDQPDLEQTTNGIKEKNKYLSPPGRGNLLYFAPSVPLDWLKDSHLNAAFVEGQKKTLALQRFFDERGEQVLVIGLSGVWNWRGTVGKKTNNSGHRQSVQGVIADFDRIAWQGREIEIIFDADAVTKDEVRSARAALAKELRARGAKVRILEMPDAVATDCKGIDDLLGAKGADFVAGWLSQARQQSAATKKRKTDAGGVVFEADSTGVKAKDTDGNATVVCSPLWIEAITRDEHAGNFGRLLRFIDPDGKEKQWAMPASLLSGDKAAYEGHLRDQGVDIFNSKHLHTYLASKSDQRVLVVARTGWHKGAFVFADECIGAEDGEEIFHQSPEGGNHLMQTAGTLEAWKKNVARYCIGNSRLILAVAAGFAATLLEKLKVESGGFQLRGGTSTGKTTVLFVGGSVWGGGSDKGFLRRWRATINGLECVAASHNDALLCLDEIAEVDPWQAGETAYMLANGQGKIRQTKNITLRRPLEWRTLFLSSGEISLADHLATVGKRTRGGMEVRLVDLPADAGQGLGVWEDLHDFKSGKELSDHLQEASKTYYGTASRVFIRQLVEQSPDELREAWRAFKTNFVKTYCPKDAKEEAGRVCDRFALVAFAGEMATEAGITGWHEGDATNALAKLFQEWLAARGPGRSDEEAAIRQVRLFLEQHSDSRFRRLGGGDERTLQHQAGYVERNDAGEIGAHYILPEVFRTEVCKGYDVRQVASALKDKGWLEATSDLKHLYQKRVKTPEGHKWSYCISSKIQEG